MHELGYILLQPWLWYGLFWSEFTKMFYNGFFWSFDSFDGYGYNNYYAAGNQMYPSGINKYYDVNSFDG